METGNQITIDNTPGLSAASETETARAYINESQGSYRSKQFDGNWGWTNYRTIEARLWQPGGEELI